VQEAGAIVIGKGAGTARRSIGGAWPSRAGEQGIGTAPPRILATAVALVHQLNLARHIQPGDRKTCSGLAPRMLTSQTGWPVVILARQSRAFKWKAGNVATRVSAWTSPSVAPQRLAVRTLRSFDPGIAGDRGAHRVLKRPLRAIWRLNFTRSVQFVAASRSRSTTKHPTRFCGRVCEVSSQAGASFRPPDIPADGNHHEVGL